MNQLQKHILFFDFLENHYVSKNASNSSLNMVKKSDFVKEDKTIVRSSHPPLNTIIINYKETEINASPFKFAKLIDANNPVSNETKKIIEQNNFVNNSLHIIGQQLDHIEEKVGKPTSSELEKSLIDLPSQRKKLSLKTSQEKLSKVLLPVLLGPFQEKGKKLFLKKTQTLILHPLLRIKLFSIYQKLKDLLENSILCLLQKTGIQNLLLLTCNLKKEFSKLSFLFLLINFMNGTLMVYLNKKLLIK